MDFSPHAETLSAALGKAGQIVVEGKSAPRCFYPAVRIEAHGLWENVLVCVDEVANLADRGLEAINVRPLPAGRKQGLELSGLTPGGMAYLPY